MKKSNVLFLCLAFIFCILQSCQQDDEVWTAPPVEEQVTSYSNVPTELWSYFENFEQEAAERGYEVDLSLADISAEIREISEDGVAGSCTYGSNHPGHIIIDKTFWNEAGQHLREMVLFHELGHCYLHRGHREDAYNDGTCVSIMRSGLGGCSDNYHGVTRPAYMDELFSEEN